MTAVVIAGAGPTGMMLAAELTLAGADVAVVERRADPELPGSRAGGLHARSIEVLDQRGIADRFLSQGKTYPVVHFATIQLDISDFPSRHPYTLGLWQSHIERILAGWVSELGVAVYRGREVIGFTPDDSGVDVELSDGTRLRAQYLVGCDGGRSLIRKAAGIDFPGWDPSTSSLIAEAEMAEEPELGVRRDERGIHGIGRLEDGKRVRIVVREEYPGASAEPTLRDLSQALIAVWGTDFGVRSPTWISRFTDMTRQAASYRAGRVLLAGDAAHVHFPIGGQGLNTGLQDAVNLGWKLAQVVSQTSQDSLLDTYHAERHPVGARVLRTTMAGTALSRSDARTDALLGTVSELLSMDEPRKRYAGELSGLDIHYDLGEGHPLLGRRMPDLDLATAGGPLRVFALLHDARPVLLHLGEPGTVDITAWADRVQLVDAKYAGPWELPVLGEVSAPAAVLIRPDGYVAWTGDPADPGLRDALAVWFGSPAVLPDLSVTSTERRAAHGPRQQLCRDLVEGRRDNGGERDVAEPGRDGHSELGQIPRGRREPGDVRRLLADWRARRRADNHAHRQVRARADPDGLGDKAARAAGQLDRLDPVHALPAGDGKRSAGDRGPQRPGHSRRQRTGGQANARQPEPEQQRHRRDRRPAAARTGRAGWGQGRGRAAQPWLASPCPGRVVDQSEDG
jgi:3-(3-hydroxy-phenyl)propionate hydroxylase